MQAYLFKFSAHSSTNLELDHMTCSVNYFKITSTKAGEEQQFQGALPASIEVTHRRPGFLWEEFVKSDTKEGSFSYSGVQFVYKSMRWHRV